MVNGGGVVAVLSLFCGTVVISEGTATGLELGIRSKATSIHQRGPRCRFVNNFCHGSFPSKRQPRGGLGVGMSNTASTRCAERRVRSE